MSHHLIAVTATILAALVFHFTVTQAKQRLVFPLWLILVSFAQNVLQCNPLTEREQI